MNPQEIIKKYNLIILFDNNEKNPNIKIINSYKVKDDAEKRCIIEYIMQEPLYKEAKRTRTIRTYIKEWKAHNVLYNWGYKRNRTKDVDLDENGYTILYAIIAFFE